MGGQGDAIMSNVLVATIMIEGIRPLLWHHFGPDALPLEKKEKSGVAGNDPEEWKRTVLMTNERQLYLEPTYIFGTLRDGAKFTPKKRGTLQPLVASTLQVLDEIVLIDRFVPVEPVPTDAGAAVYVDVRSVRNPTTRGRNVRYRVAASPGWQASFTVLWDSTIVSRRELQAVANDAGRFAGLGDGRSIGNGRFVVTACDIRESAQGHEA